MINDWIILTVADWQEFESEISTVTTSIAAVKDEIAAINGVMTRSKRTKLKILEDKLDFEETCLGFYTACREVKIEETKMILDQLRDFGFACPTIQFEPFEYTYDEFCKLLDECQSIANDARDLRMSGFRCTLFY